MSLPVIANVFRVTFNWRAAGGGHTVNVLHFLAPGLDEAAVAAGLQTALDGLADPSHFAWPLPTTWELTDVDIIKLDGTSGSLNFNIVSGTAAGGASGSPVYQTAGVVSLKTGQRGPSARGRVYMGPMAEDAQASGVVNVAGWGVWRAAWEDFVPLADAEGVILGVASYSEGVWRAATATANRTYVGTMRRRAKFLQ